MSESRKLFGVVDRESGSLVWLGELLTQGVDDAFDGPALWVSPERAFEAMTEYDDEDQFRADYKIVEVSLVVGDIDLTPDNI